MCALTGYNRCNPTDTSLPERAFAPLANPGAPGPTIPSWRSQRSVRRGSGLPGASMLAGYDFVQSLQVSCEPPVGLCPWVSPRPPVCGEPRTLLSKQPRTGESPSPQPKRRRAQRQGLPTRKQAPGLPILSRAVRRDRPPEKRRFPPVYDLH